MSLKIQFRRRFYTEYQVSYSQYLHTHITGQSLSISYEIGSDDTLSNNTFSKFEYKLEGDKLYNGSGEKLIEMRRCLQKVIYIDFYR